MVEATKDAAAHIDDYFESWFLKGLGDFVRVPNLTMMADKEFATNGLIQDAMACVDKYVSEL
jgi:phage gp36-like protein